jgi:metallo-beta-lactamase family protein
MCNAGRIKHHLANSISSVRNTVLFVGYQAIGTLGRQILDGRKTVRIHGANRRVRARIAQIHGLSAHADQESLLRWVGNLKQAPRRIFLTHGEPQSAKALGEEIARRWGWPVTIPEYKDVVELE